ncbi:MAG: efflux RND transporter periplasmic adaptor subunit [Bacteroidetes bacterium]|nr:efflux RND transporter periplasmic adaptor subunit [Bacteroidota bacterium]
MKQFLPFLFFTLALASCGSKTQDPAAQIAALKKQRADIDIKIREIQASSGVKDSVKKVPVALTEVQPQKFQAFIDVQANIKGDDDVIATPQAPGTVSSIAVHVGQHVRAGQTLASLDAAPLEQQLAAQEVQLGLLKSLYEKQKSLWAQNIGTEVQLISAKAQYEAAVKSKAALLAQRAMYRIVAPISGVVDAVNIKQGDMASPGSPLGIRVVNDNKLKAEAHLGEVYLGKVKVGDPVTLIFPDQNDSLKRSLTFVAQGIDPVSRAFTVQVLLGSSAKLHPNMSAKMRIANYADNDALVVPVAAIQQTSEGAMVFINNGGVAKSVLIQTGRNANGNVEVLSGLKPGDQVVTAGYEDLDDGVAITTE